MKGELRRVLCGTSIVIFTALPFAGAAQTDRLWVDPPAEGQTQAGEAAPSASTPSRPVSPKSSPKSTAPAAQPSATAESGGGGKAEAEQAQSASAPEMRDSAKQAKETVTGRSEEVREAPSAPQKRRVSASQQRELRARARKAAPRTAARNRADERLRQERYRTAQEGIDDGLQVMRLRTIQFPDGRRMTILTRPDVEIGAGVPYAPYR